MKQSLLLTVIISISFVRVFGQNGTNVLPTERQVDWANAEIGVIIHFDMNAFAPESYDYMNNKTLPPSSVFHPSALNTDQWVLAAKSAGAKYAVLVVKHGTGFSLWPTKAHPYNVGNTPWKNGRGDVLADFLKSCRKYGVKPGIYYSVNSNSLYGIVGHADSSTRMRYNKMLLKQLKELWGGGYGKFFEIWFDGGILPSSQGGVSDEIAILIKKYQPQAVLFQGLPSTSKNIIRWMGNENGDAPYPMWSRTNSTTSSDGIVEIPNSCGNPDGNLWCPAESDFPSRKKSAWEGGWFWHANRDEDILSVNDLIKKYYSCVGQNTNMLIGMAIDTSGQFPAKETQLFKAFGDSIKEKFSHCLGKIETKKKETILNFGGKAVRCNQIVLMEDIAGGENIRKYTLDAWINNQWQKVGGGLSVGHKHIEVFSPIITDKLKLTIDSCEGNPYLKLFAAYYN
jgi:alpha-L-fucosidase